MSITKFNHKEYAFDYDLKQVKEWKKCKDLIGQTVRVKVIGTHASENKKYGDSVFMVTWDNIGINLPTWYADTVKEILADEESVNDIKSGKVLAKFSKYQTKNGDSVGVEYLEESLPF